MSPTKKILYLITKANFGGAQRYVFDLATHMTPHAAIVVAHGEGGLLHDKLSAASIKTIALPLKNDMGLASSIASFRSIVHLLRTERPDILHLNSSKAALVGAAAARFVGVPRIVFTAHGWVFNEPRPIWERLLLRFLQMTTVMLCHHTIYVSHMLKRQIWIAALFPHTVIHNGVDTTISLFDKENARKRLETVTLQRMNTHLVVTIAELHPVKGLDDLIEAAVLVAEKDPMVSFVIFGEGKDRARLEALIAQKNAPVFLAGFVANASQYLPACDLFVLSSLSEGLAYALLEAGRASVPVVATRVGGIPEIIDKNTGTLVPVRAPSILANTIITLLADEAHRTQLATALHHKVISEFSLEAMLEKTRRVYTL